MKITIRSLVPVFVLILLALSAVGVASAQNFSDIAGTIRSAITRQSANEMEITGTITSITPETWTVDGTEFQVLPQTEVKGAFVVGDVVKVHLFTATDGSLTAREVEFAETGIANDNNNDNGEIENENGNVNDNEAMEDDNGNMNSNDNEEMDEDNGNTNSNDNEEIDDDNGNTNSNDNGGIEDNDNDNTNDNGNLNENSNDNGSDDHGNTNDHHDDDDGNGNGHHDDDDNDNGGFDD